MPAQGKVVGHVAVGAAAAELGVSRRQVYLLRGTKQAWLRAWLACDEDWYRT